ncbi:MAG: helix-turn-helix domain-containing protein [Flavobacteriaceae bacterium]|nr:helix-turn-helix domain-containing protein [Flavobacteriaceae bacterium]
MHFVNSSIYNKARRLGHSEQLDQTLFEKHDASKELQHSASYLPIDLLYEVYEKSTEMLEAGFSVRQGLQLNTDDYGTLGLSWKTCWVAKEVLDRVERFMMLVTDHGHIKQSESDGHTTIYLNRRPARLGVEIANETSFVMLNQILSEVTGKHIKPVYVAFQHGSKSEKQLAAYFECNTEFKQPENLMKYRTEDINIRTIKVDKSIHRFLVDRMNEEMSKVNSNADLLLKEVHQMVKESLPSGIPSLIQVAEFLGMSARTLKRRLSDKGITFRECVQNIQREEALTLLSNPSQSMAEIAYQTGFSEQSAFNRAFKRWTGKSPTSYRSDL